MISIILIGAAFIVAMSALVIGALWIRAHEKYRHEEAVLRQTREIEDALLRGVGIDNVARREEQLRLRAKESIALPCRGPDFDRAMEIKELRQTQYENYQKKWSPILRWHEKSMTCAIGPEMCGLNGCRDHGCVFGSGTDGIHICGDTSRVSGKT